MNYLAIIQFASFFGYLVYLFKKVGVLKSISDSWYALGPPINKSYLFNLFAAGVGLPMWAFGHESLAINDGGQMLFALSGFFMVCLSIASTFKSSKMVNRIHYFCTLLAIGFALGAIYVAYHDWYFWHMVGIIALGCIPLYFVPNKLLWIEIWVFIPIIGRIFLHHNGYFN